MKGFKKDGKFRPTEKRTKSALKKSDLQSRTRQKKDIAFKPERQGARVKILTGEFAGKTGVISQVGIFTEDFGVRVDEVDNEFQTSAMDLKSEDVEFLEGDPAKKSEEPLQLDSDQEAFREHHGKTFHQPFGDPDEDNEKEDPHVIPQTIFDQLQESKVNGFPFFAYTGIKGFVMMGNDTLMLKDIPRNPNHVSSVTIVYDEGRDLYNLMFQKGKFPKNVPLKEVDGIFVDQLSDIIVDTMGVR